MTPKQIVALGIRLFVIWMALLLLRQLPGQVKFFHDNLEDSVAVTVLLGTTAVVFVVCLLLWFFPLSVAGKLLPGSGAPPTQSASVDEWFAMGCSLIGIWLLAYSLPALLFYYAPLLHYGTRTDSRFAWDLPAGLNALRLAGECAIGIWLFFGGRGLRGLVRWARTAGQ